MEAGHVLHELALGIPAHRSHPQSSLAHSGEWSTSVFKPVRNICSTVNCNSECRSITASFTVKAVCSMSLQRFPMDVQTCSLILSSCQWMPTVAGDRDVLLIRLQMPTERKTWSTIGNSTSTVASNSHVSSYPNSISSAIGSRNAKFD